jgi:phosphatidylglycerophosphate synthase
MRLLIEKIPNIITASRLVLGLFLLVEWNFLSSGFMFLASFWGPFSDFLDGYAARIVKGSSSKFGAIFDVVADKVFLYSFVFGYFFSYHYNFLFFLIIIWLLRDTFLIILFFISRTTFKAHILGKIYAALQFLFVFLFALNNYFKLDWLFLSFVFSWIFFVLAFFVIAAYYRYCFK